MFEMRFGRLSALVALAMALVGGVAENAYATHYRYGTINWSIPDPAYPNRIQFRVTTGWRRSFDCSPGETPPSCTPWGLNHYPNIGDVINLNYAAGLTFDFGDGTGAVNMTGATVTAISASEDWLVAEWTATHTYPWSGAFVAYLLECCRISTLADGNDDRYFRLESRVTVGGPMNRPPSTSSLPVITVGASQPITFAIPASDPDGHSLVFKFTNASSTAPPNTGFSGLITPSPAGMTMTSAGVISWTPAALSSGTERLHAVQIKIDDGHGAFTTLDVVLRVVNLPPGTAPTVTINGSATPVTISIVPNQLATATIDVNDVDINPSTGLPDTLVTLNTGGLPGGASVTPSLPSSGAVPYSVTFSWTPAFGDQGAHTVVFGATDNTGRSRSNALHIIVENQPPVNICSVAQTVEALSPSGASATVSTEVGDPDGDPLTVRWYIDGVLVRTDDIPGGPPPTSAMLDFTNVYGLGSHVVHIGVFDDHDHVTDCDTTVTVQDTTAPAFAAPLSQTLEAASPSGAAATWETPVATDAADSSVPVVCDAASGATFPLGTTMVECSASDDSGNTATQAFSIAVIDTTPPAFDAPPSQTLEALGPGGAPASWTTPTATDIADAAVTVECDAVSGVFPLGTTPVHCSATDDSGNTTAHSFAINVVDTTPPAISSPGDQSALSTSPGGAAVSWTVSASDLVDGPVSVDCTPASGSTFLLGATPVLCSAADAHGNTSTASFVVRVVDATPPTIDGVAPSASMLWPPNHQMVPIALTVDAADESGPPACSIVSVASSEPQNGLGDGDTPGDWTITGPLSVDLRAERAGRGPGRAYTISVRCTDAAGNAATGSTTVMVPRSMGR